MAATGSLASHTAHFVIFGTPAVLLGALVAYQELRGRLVGRQARPAGTAAPVVHPEGLSAWRWLAAVSTGLAGLTHASVIREHFKEDVLYGIFFTVLMVVQLIVGGMLLRRPSTRLLQRVGLGSASVIGLWVISRTSGLPIGPTPWRPETVGGLDVFASVCELLAALACARLLIYRASWPDGPNPAPGMAVRTGSIFGRVEARVSAALTTVTSLLAWFPKGRRLPQNVWVRRHAGIVRFALIQAVAVGAFGLVRHFAIALCLADVALVGFPALLACSTHAGRRLRTVSATVSLMLASVTIVDLAGGTTEAHFHFFVMLGVVALYQDWTAFGVCILICVVDHAVMGSLLPRDVYGTPSERNHPITWAFVHGGFLLAAAFTHLLAWRNSEKDFLSDPLTQLPNRTAFNDRLAAAVADTRQPVIVLFIDLDHFKNINDSYGHAVGDQALQAAAERMATCIRQTDLLARLGGDEFAIVVQGPRAFGPALAGRISTRLQAPLIVDGVTVFVRASIGVADSDQAGSRVGEVLLRCADLAMYMAKSSGKNNVVVYDAEMDQAVRDRAELAAAIQPALAEGQFELYFQPVVKGEDRTLVGVEALIRWHHPTLGMVPPATFIPLAEANTEICALGLWVLRTGAARMANWNAARPDAPDLTLAINVSPVQLGQDDFVDSVTQALNVTGLAPHLLIIEVTEGLRLYDWQASCERLRQLRALGVKVAIDDFGTGYSSLSYLAELPADIVKIDQSFVRDLHSDSGSVFLVKAVMEAAKSFGLDVIAEGVETLEQQRILTELGCLHLQGYLHGKPLPADGITALLAFLSDDFVLPEPSTSKAPKPV